MSYSVSDYNQLISPSDKSCRVMSVLNIPRGIIPFEDKLGGRTSDPAKTTPGILGADATTPPSNMISPSSSVVLR